MRKIMPFKTLNNLEYFLREIQHRDYMNTKIKKPRKHYEEELARYLNVSRSNVVLIKKFFIQPSLPLAMKMCEYFECKIEEMFQLVDNEEYYRTTLEEPTEINDIILENDEEEVQFVTQ